MRFATVLLLLSVVAASLFAATPGSYQTIALDLVLLHQNAEQMTDLPGGAIQVVAKRREVHVRSASLLAEAQRLGRIESTTGYRLVATWDANAQPLGFYAYHKGDSHAVSLDDIIAIHPDGARGRAEKGKVVHNRNGVITSGKLAFADALPLRITLDGTTWTGLLQLAGARTPRPGVDGEPVWLNGLTSGGFSSVGDNQSILKGAVLLGPATFAANLRSLFIPDIVIDPDAGGGVWADQLEPVSP